MAVRIPMDAVARLAVARPVPPYGEPDWRLHPISGDARIATVPWADPILLRQRSETTNRMIPAVKLMPGRTYH